MTALEGAKTLNRNNSIEGKSRLLRSGNPVVTSTSAPAHYMPIHETSSEVILEIRLRRR